MCTRHSIFVFDMRKMVAYQLLFFFVLLSFLSTVWTIEKPIVLWTQKSYVWSKFRGIYGEPEMWVRASDKKYITSHTSKEGWRYGITYDQNTDSVVWTDKESMQIMKQPLNDTFVTRKEDTIKQILNTGSKGLNALAIDWTTGNLYFTDITLRYVAVASGYKEGIYRILANVDVNSPNGITVDPYEGMIYWTDSGGNNPRIEGSTLYGWNRKTLLSSNIIYPTGICMDYIENRLYWIDQGKASFEYYDLNNGKRMIFNIQHTNYVGISVYKNYAFITNSDNLSMNIYNKNKGNLEQTTAIDATPYHVTVAEIRRKPSSECSSKKCDHICVPVESTKAVCDCSVGYTLEPDGVTCTLTLSKYVYTVGTHVVMVNAIIPDSIYSHVKLIENNVASDMQKVQALAGHSSKGFIFYNDVVQDVLYRSDEKGNAHIEVTVNTREVHGMAVDWLTSTLYWTDFQLGHIMCCKMDGSYHTILIENLSSPGAIVIDAVRRNIFVVIGGTTIRRLNLDGSDKGEFHAGSGHVRGLAVDSRTRRLYWTDATNNKIFSAYVNGSDVQTFSIQGNIYDVTVFQEYTNWITPRNGFNFLHKPTNTRLAVSQSPSMAVSSDDVFDVITFSAYSQPSQKGPCDVDNGGCEHHCFPMESNVVCRCAIGYILSQDLKSCESNITNTFQYLIYVDPYHRQIYQQTLDNPVPQGIKLPSVVRPSSVDYIYGMSKLFWIDDDNHDIRSATMKGEDYKRYSLSPGAYPIKLAADPSNSKIIFTDRKRGTLSYVTTDDSSTEDIIDGLQSPAGLAVNYVTGDIYWSEASPSGKIGKTNSDGTDWSYLITTGLQNPTDISLDSTGSTLYIADSDSGQILSLNLTSNDLKTEFQEAALQISSVTVDDSSVFFTTNNEKGIYRINKGNKELVGVPIYARITDIKAIYGKYEVAVGKTDPGLNLIPIIVGALAALLLLLLLAALLAACIRRKKPREKEEGFPPGTTDAHGMSESDQMYANMPNDTIMHPGGGYYNGDPEQPAANAQVWNNPGIENDYAPAANGAAQNNTEAAQMPIGAVPAVGAAAGVAAATGPGIGAIVAARKKNKKYKKSTKTKFSDLSDGATPENKFELSPETKVATKIQRAVGRLRNKLSSVRWSGSTQAPPQELTQPEISDDTQGGSEPDGGVQQRPPPSKNYVWVPPKLHDMPRGFKPASSNIPTGWVKQTWGRAKMKNAAKK